LRALQFSLLPLCALPALGGEPNGAPTRGIAAVEEFMQRARPLCPIVPAERCIDIAWRFTDRNDDRRLSTQELAIVKAEIEAWTLWKGDRLSASDQASIALGLWMIDSIGLERLAGRYDVDGESGISRSELLADLRLDQRPLPQILKDPNGLDRDAMSQRLSQLSPLIDGMLQQP
ncbi:MAG: hypothetical protein ACREDZ_08870, partial [Kiloniellales bacterium]